MDFYHVYLDDDVNMARPFNISAVPVLLRWENGKEVERLIGFQPEEAVRRLAAPR